MLSNGSDMTTKGKTRSSQDSGSTLKQALLESSLIGGKLPQTRVFVNYRREDSRAACDHLYASLVQCFGKETVFRDLDSLKPGQDFPAVIDREISNTSVFIALIGRRWLTVRKKGGRRLDDPGDHVRLEIESALRYRVTVIPVMVDGAKMPLPKDLPESLAKLADFEYYELPWHQGIVKLQTRIAEVERERARREDEARARREGVDLASGFPRRKSDFNVVIDAMQTALKFQGRRVSLDSDDLAASIAIVTGRPFDQGFTSNDMAYVIDMVGVKAMGSQERFVARSYRLRSFDDILAQLKLRRPILASVSVFESWFRKPASKTGIIDLTNPGHLRGHIVAILVAWDPWKSRLKVRTPWPTWGNKGHAIMTRAVAERCINLNDMRSIEPALAPRPIFLSPKAAAKLAAKTAKEFD
jgi:hypothetical protein